MPKVIDKIEERIHQSAFRLFSAKRYNQVTMKMIATEVGISVGTLYNYYLNKQDLFLKVYKQNLEQIHSILDRILLKEGSTHDFIAALYDEVVRIRELSEEILKDKADYSLIKDIQKYLLGLIGSLIYQTEEKKNLRISEENKNRAIRLLLLAVNDFSREFPNDRDNNIEFICRLTEKIKQ